MGGLISDVWAELVPRTFEFDVLACPRSSGRLRLVALMPFLLGISSAYPRQPLAAASGYSALRERRAENERCATRKIVLMLAIVPQSLFERALPVFLWMAVCGYAAIAALSALAAPVDKFDDAIPLLQGRSCSRDAHRISTSTRSIRRSVCI